MSDPEGTQKSPQDLQDLDARLKKMKTDGVVRDPHAGPKKSGAGSEAARYAVEFVAAVGIGFAIGWYLDAWLGTRPWLMVVVGLLGFAAGVMNVYRAAEEASKREKAEKLKAEAEQAEADTVKK